MTETDRTSLGAFHRLTELNSMPPTVREFARELGITSTPAFERLLRLEQRGWLSRRPSHGTVNYDRVYLITPEGRKALEGAKA